MKRTKTQKGITLVALIITIVVLLILAMVSINSIQNEGVMKQAQNAAEKYNEEQAKEQNTLLDYEKWFDIYGGDTASYKAYSVGDSVTVQGEEFWVIQDSGTNEANVVLLAKKAIDTSNLVQSETPNQIAFSESMYWPGDAATDIIEPEEADPSHYAAYAAYRYGEKLGGKGRLLTATEAVSVNGNSSIITNGTWIGTRFSNTVTELWILVGDGSFRSISRNYDGEHYVRPVVEIAKNKLS